MNSQQLRDAKRSLGKIPIVVLTHEPLKRREGESQEMRNAQNRIRRELHQEIANLSPRGSVRVVKESGHFFQLEQPGWWCTRWWM